jgi:hypothetical protein
MNQQNFGGSGLMNMGGSGGFNSGGEVMRGMPPSTFSGGM